MIYFFFTKEYNIFILEVNKYVTNFIKLNLQFSPSMQEGLYKIINNHLDGKKTDDLTTPINDGGKNIHSGNIDVKKTLAKVVLNLNINGGSRKSE